MKYYPFYLSHRTKARTSYPTRQNKHISPGKIAWSTSSRKIILQKAEHWLSSQNEYELNKFILWDLLRMHWIVTKVVKMFQCRHGWLGTADDDWGSEMREKVCSKRASWSTCLLGEPATRIIQTDFLCESKLALNIWLPDIPRDLSWPRAVNKKRVNWLKMARVSKSLSSQCQVIFGEPKRATKPAISEDFAPTSK